MQQPELQRYQVVVETKSGREMRVGPVLHDRAIVETCVEEINKNVASGKEKDWRNARCATVEPETDDVTALTPGGLIVRH